MKKTFRVAVYDDHHFVMNVDFRKKWKAFVFHWLINRSIWSNGTREF